MATVNHLLTDANTAVSPRTTGAFVPTAGSLMLAFTFSSGTAVGFGTFSTNNGIAFVKAGTSAAAGGNAHALHCFVATSTSNAVSQTATFNSVGDQSTGNIIFIFEVIGASGTGTSAIEQTAKQDNQAGPSTPAPAFSVAASSANVIAGCVGIEGANSGFSGTTVTWGSSESIYCSMIVEIKAAVAVPNLIYMNTRRTAAHRFLTIR
jgi:hypothetical protein